MTQRAYLAGYTSRKPEQLLSLAEMFDAVVVDARYNPVSRVPHWNQGPLKNLLGNRYKSSRGFGNSTYKQGFITLADPSAGLRSIQHDERVIILCACKDGASCHRKQVGEYLALHGWEVREVTEGEWRQGSMQSILPGIGA